MSSSFKFFIILIIILISTSHTRAAGADSGTQTVCQSIGSMFDMVLRFGTAFWMIPVILTGKLLTNEIVYGQFIHFDIYLYSFWNLIKNIANYSLAFLFIIKILLLVKNGSDNIMIEIPKMLKGMIISAIFIQISRRAMGMLIDLSSLGIATVASLPSQIIQANPQYQKYFEATLDQSYGRSINFDTHEMNTIHTSISPSTIPSTSDNTAYFFMNTDLDQLLPRYDNVSGPLMIMGMSMMKFMDGYKQSSTTMTCTNIALSTLFRAVILIFYLLPVLILMLISIARVFKLWIYITFSPFAALFYGLRLGNFGHQEVLPGTLDDYVNQINIKDVLSLIFQPILLVGSLSVGIVFLVAMYGTFSLGSTDGHYVYNFDLGSSIHTVGNTSQFTHRGGDEFYLQGSLVGEEQLNTNSPIGYIMISIFTIMILRSIVTIATLPEIIGDGMLGNWIRQGTGLIKDTVKSSQIIPLPGIGGVSIDNLNRAPKTMKNRMENSARGIMAPLNEGNEKQADKFAQMFGVSQKLDIASSDQATITQKLKQYSQVQKNQKLSFNTVHDQTKQTFETLKGYVNDRTVNLGSSHNFKSILQDRYSHVGGKKYLQATGVLDLDEPSFKDKDGKVLDDTQIASKLFDFTQAQKGNSQGRFVQFLNLAMKDNMLRDRLSKAVTSASPTEVYIDNLVQAQHTKKMPIKRDYKNISNSKIVTDPKDQFDPTMITHNLSLS